MGLYFITNAVLAVRTIGGMRERWHVALALALLGGLTLAAMFDTGNASRFRSPFSL